MLDGGFPVQVNEPHMGEVSLCFWRRRNGLDGAI